MIWPAAFLVNSFQMSPSVNLRAYADPYGGSEQVVDLLNDRWHCSLTVSPRRDVDGAALEGFIYGLRQGINTVDLWHMLRPAPAGTMRGTPLLSAAAQGAASLSITGAGAYATVKAGDMLGVGVLVMAQSDCAADASGNITIPIVNRLRKAAGSVFTRSTTATYIDGSGVLQTAGVNVPRYQGGVLLVEAAATNLLAYSTGMVAHWGSNGDTGWSDDYGTAPDGTKTTTRAAFGGTRFLSGVIVGSANYCYSIFYEKAAGASVSIFVDGGTVNIPTGAAWVSLDLGTLALGSLGGGATSCGVIDYGTYCRAWVSFTSAAAASVANCHVFPAAGNPEAWGAQLEVGSAPTSYIPTTSAAVTRAADQVTNPVVWNQPTAPFRMVGSPAIGYVPGVANALSLDFVEAVS